MPHWLFSALPWSICSARTAKPGRGPPLRRRRPRCEPPPPCGTWGGGDGSRAAQAAARLYPNTLHLLEVGLAPPPLPEDSRAALLPDADSDDDEPVARPLPSSLGLAHLAYLTTVMRSQISLSG